MENESKISGKAFLIAALIALACLPGAQAQYYVPQNKSAPPTQAQETPVQEPEKKPSFFSRLPRYFLGKKKPPPAESSAEQRSIFQNMNKPPESPVFARQEPNALPDIIDPREENWKRESQALQAQLYASHKLLGDDYRPYGACSPEEAKIFKSITDRFEQGVKEHSKRSKNADAFAGQMDRYAAKPENAGKIALLFQKCGV